MSEFARLFDAARLPLGEQALVASEAECTALAKRFGLVAIGRLEARVEFSADGGKVDVTGKLTADVVQSCAISGDDLPVRIAEPVALRFVPALSVPDGEDEIELDADQPDEIEMENARFDLGEALAQGLALAIDPYAEGPGADEARRKAGLLGAAEAGPFAALKGLLKNPD